MFISSTIMSQNALDKNGKTALDLCENVNKRDSQSAASLLRIAMSQPVRCTVSRSIRISHYNNLNKREIDRYIDR